jgi:hypothetical protein
MKPSELRAQLLELVGGNCEWPGCVDPSEQMAHLTHRGMGGSYDRNNIANVMMLCVRHHDTLDGRTGLGTLRWELNELLRTTVVQKRIGIHYDTDTSP